MKSPAAAHFRHHATLTSTDRRTSARSGTCIADAIVRYRRRSGHDVRFQSGTDDNSLKSVRAAALAGTTPADLVARNAGHFQALAAALNVSFDDFVKTSADPRHFPAVFALWHACARAGDIYRRHYRGLYCVGCEQFFGDGELTDNVCPEHALPLEIVEEENYFFRASRYGARIRELIASDALCIRPRLEKRDPGAARTRPERLHISRSRARAHGWGCAGSCDPEQVIYVWSPIAN